MNPGGDYGKKELSPALRNRFTEIWVPPVGDLNELKSIVLQRFSNPNQSHIVDAMLSFWEVETNNLIYTKLSRMENFGWGDLGMTADISCTENMQCDNIFGINPFYIEKGLGSVVVAVAVVINYAAAVESNRFSSLCLIDSQLAVIICHFMILNCFEVSSL
ncbi:uncharacterized protein LOC112036220 isoform X2 [Quercus suber]